VIFNYSEANTETHVHINKECRTTQCDTIQYNTIQHALWIRNWIT